MTSSLPRIVPPRYGPLYVGSAAGIALFVATLIIPPSSPIPDLPARLDTFGLYGGFILALIVAYFSAIGMRQHRSKSLQPTSYNLKVDPSDCFVAILVALGVAIFALPLLQTWWTGVTDYQYLGGLLPWADSHGYFMGAINLLHTQTYDPWSMRRPINGALNALRFVIAGGDLQVMLALNALALALTCLVAAREVSRSASLTAGILFFVLLFQFGRAYVPNMLSETWGLIFGTLAFAVLWRSALTGSVVAFGLGMFVLTVALNARAGAFFVLPALMLWGAAYLDPNRRWSWIGLSTGLAGILAGFAVPIFYLALWGSDQGQLHGNFAHILYGMAVGGKGWLQIYADHPEIFKLASLAEQNSRIYDLAIAEILRDPIRFIGAYFHESLSFPKHILNYMPGHLVLNMIHVPLLLAGGGAVLLRYRARDSSFLLFAFVGILISAPFLMPDGGPRAFAATVPFTAVFPAMGAGLMVRAIRAIRKGGFVEERVDPEVTQDGVRFRLVTGAGLIISVLLLAPVAAIGLQRWPKIEKVSCPAGEISSVYLPGRTAVAIRIHDDQDLPTTMVPNLRLTDFRRDRDFAQIEIGKAFTLIKGPATVLLVYDVRQPPRAQVWAIADGTDTLPRSGGPVLLCGRQFTKNEAGRSWPTVIRVNTIRQLPE